MTVSICLPTRGRPERFAEMYRSALDTAQGDIEVIAVYDDDDPTITDYPEGPIYVQSEPGTNQSDMWNQSWANASGDIAHMGADDLIYRTPGWDRQVAKAFLRWMPDRIGMVYCVVPETPVLMADLSYVPAGKLAEGDEVFGFDEEPVHGPKHGKYRRLQVATVTNATRAVQPLVRVTTDSSTVVVSEDHQFLVVLKKNRRPKSLGQAGSHQWVRARELSPDEHVIVSLGEPWEREETHEAGWLAGMFDGEGNVLRGGRVMISQNPGPVLDRVEVELLARGFRCTRSLTMDRAVVRLIPLGGLMESLRLLGTLRPERLVSKRKWTECGALNRISKTAVLSVESVGTGEVVELSTSTRTFVAAGLLSHNCNDRYPLGRKPYAGQTMRDTDGEGFSFSANPFVTRDWIEAVGTFTPPYYESWEADTWIYLLAESISRAQYLHRVVIEHMHPMAGKAEMDPTYERGAWGNKRLQRIGWARTKSPAMRKIRAEQTQRLTEAIQSYRLENVR